MIVEPKREILLMPLLRAGVLRAWTARDQFVRLAIVPAVAMVAILAPLVRMMNVMLVAEAEKSTDFDPNLGVKVLALSFAYGVALNSFSVNWLRQLTLGPGAAPGLGIGFAPRHFRFLLLIVALSILTSILGVFLILILSPFGIAGAMAGLMATILIWAMLMVRLSPSWIGIALDAPMPLRVAWRRTAGSGFKLLVAVLAIEVPLLFAHQLIAGVFEVTGLMNAAPLTFILFTSAMHLVGTALQLAILVTAFPQFLRETV